MVSTKAAPNRNTKKRTSPIEKMQFELKMQDKIIELQSTQLATYRDLQNSNIKIDELTSEVKELNTRVTSVENKVDMLDKKFDKRIDDVEKKFDNRIDNLEKKFDKRIDDLKNEMKLNFDDISEMFQYIAKRLPDSKDAE